MADEILVTGGSGRIGGYVLKHLIDDYGEKPRVLVRAGSVVDAALADKVTLATGDFADPAALAEAVDGVSAVFLISPVDPKQRELQGNVARAAAAAGRPLIVKISGLGTALDSYVDSGRWHAEIEADIASLNLPFTFLRPHFFMQNLAFQLPGARTDGVIRAAVEDARIAMIDYRDIAEVAAALLVGRADLLGQAVPITGSQAVDNVQVASTLAQLLGRNVDYEKQTLDEARMALQSGGQPAWHVELILQFNRAFLDGWGATVSTVVEDVLGRPPRTLEDCLSELVRSGHTQRTNPFPS